MMKVAISSSRGGKDDIVNRFFGRCPKFTIAEISDSSVKWLDALDNPGHHSGGGAGVSASQLLINNGVDAIITGNCGPKAMSALKMAKIPVYHASGGISKAVEDLINDKLSKIEPEGFSGFR